jgi:hypothetical protein
MKTIKMLFAILILASSAHAQTIRVEGDKRLKADIGEFKTFGFSSQVDNKLDEGFYFFNDLVFKADVRNAVESELLGLGYRRATSSPDMIVNFRMFDKPVTIKGFEDFGTSYWSGIPVRDPDSPTAYDVEAGTIMVHLVNAKSGEVIWQGFASGLVDGDSFLKDPAKIKEAVSMIFDEFGQRANEYTRK